MKSRRMIWLAVLLAVCVCMPAAAQEGAPIVTYALPQGAVEWALEQAQGMPVPDGLQPMYDLLLNASAEGDVYIVQMPNGYAALSVSCREVSSPGTAQTLLEMWPEVARSIAAECDRVDSSKGCARIDTQFDMDVLHVRTDIQKDGLALEAECRVFYQGSDLIELWTLSPAAPVFAFSPDKHQKWQDDRADLDAMVKSMVFPGQAEMMLSALQDGVTDAADIGDAAAAEPQQARYVTHDGMFSLVLPEGCIVLTPLSTEVEVQAARETFVAQHMQGAEALFDHWVDNIRSQGVTVLMSHDAQVVLELSASTDSELAGLSLTDLYKLAGPITKMLTDDFGFAVYMDETSKYMAGAMHAGMVFWLRSGETDMGLTVLCATGDGCLRELDVFRGFDAMDMADQNAFVQQVCNTLQYLTPET